MTTQPLQFTRHHPPYAEGEVAWFRPEKAQRLIEGGFARPAERPAAPSTPDSVAVRTPLQPTPVSSPAASSNDEWLPENWREHTPLRQRGIALRLGAPKDIAKDAVIKFLTTIEAEWKRR